MNSTSGATEFRNSVRQQKSPYSIFAVKLPIEELVPELQNRFRIESWQQNINRSGKLSDLVGVPIVKFKDNPWSIVYWSIGRYLDLTSDCSTISRKFDCQLIVMYESDQAGLLEWVVYQGEDESEVASLEEDGMYFESSLRKEPKDLEDIEDKNVLKSRLDQLVDELLVKENLSIPALTLDLNDPNIDRIDLLILPALPLGMRDFQKFIYQGHPEYSIFAVKADIDRVVPALIENPETTEWRKNLQSDTKIWDNIPNKEPYFIPVVQPKENQWTVVFWHVGDWTGISDICTNISSELDTLVMSIGEEDTSGAIGYELFDRGKSIERAEGCPGDELFFESQVREEPEFDDFDDDESDAVNQFINNRFAEEGIYIPSWELSVSDPWIDRVDLLQKNF
jgi:hypothetical protein